MPPSADDKLIENGVQDFIRGLHSELPLRHFGEFHDQEKLKKVADLQKENVFRKVFDKIWTREREEIVSLGKKLYRRIDQEVITEWVKKNQEHQIQSVSFLQKWVDMLCENFNDAMEYQLRLNPDIELGSLKNCISSRKLNVIKLFESNSIWKPGTSQMQEERKSKLEKQLQVLEEKLFEKHQRNLESISVEEGEMMLREVRTILLERSRQLKCYVIQHQGKVSAAILRERVKEISDYLLKGKGSTLKESHDEIFSKLVEMLEGETQFLTEKLKESMTTEDVIGYAERFDETLRSCCVDNVAVNVQEMLENRTRLDHNNVEPRNSMQEILNEIKDQSDSFDLGKEPDGLTHESIVNGDDTVKSTNNLEDTLPPNFEEDGDIVQPDTLRMSTPSSPLLSFRANKRSKGNEVCLKGSFQKPKRSENAFSKKTRRTSGRNGSQTASSERPLLNESKLPRARRISPSGSKDCPKNITILDGDCPKFSCNVCSKEFKLKRYLKYHGEFCGMDKSKSFICDECGKGFHLKANLVAHARIHTGEKPFECPKCPERFTRRGNLQHHIRRHAKERLLICNLCNLTFVSCSSLNEHNRTTHEEKLPFACSYCDNRSYCMSKLRNHVITHADERPFECSKCEASFVKFNNLHLHLVNVHSLQKQIAQKLAYDAAVVYLLKETKNEALKNIPANRINATVVNHIIQKANLQLPDAS